MPCCRGQNYDRLFGAKTARKELRAYRKRGPRGATARLLRLIQASGARDASLLDIGGGIGVIAQELIKAGAAAVTSVDASAAYHATTRSVARDLGRDGDWTSIEGDFVERAAAIAPADIVTLDKVICCYPDMPLLVAASAGKASRLYGIVVPRDARWVRAGATLGNFVLRLLRFDFQGFVHPIAAIDAVVKDAGLSLTATDAYWLWSVRLYARTAEVAPPPRRG
jgi:magnesium-protoporphyrin O-methyltransferase